MCVFPSYCRMLDQRQELYVNVLSLKEFQAFEIKNSYLHNKGLLQCYTTRQYYSILQTVSSGALALRILDSTYVVVHSMYSFVCSTIQQKVLFPSPQRIWRRLRFAALNSFRTAAQWTKNVQFEPLRGFLFLPKIRQSKINSSLVAGPMGQMNRRPSV